MVIGRGQAEVIVGVRLDLEIRHGLQLANQGMCGKRLQNANCIGKTKTPGATTLRHLDYLFEKIAIGTRGIVTADADKETVVPRNLHIDLDLRQHPVQILA